MGVVEEWGRRGEGGSREGKRLLTDERHCFLLFFCMEHYRRILLLSLRRTVTNGEKLKFSEIKPLSLNKKIDF